MIAPDGTVYEFNSPQEVPDGFTAFEGSSSASQFILPQYVVTPIMPGSPGLSSLSFSSNDLSDIDLGPVTTGSNGTVTYHFGTDQTTSITNSGNGVMQVTVDENTGVLFFSNQWFFWYITHKSTFRNPQKHKLNWSYSLIR